jgi:hypothetical protein
LKRGDTEIAEGRHKQIKRIVKDERVIRGIWEWSGQGDWVSSSKKIFQYDKQSASVRNEK